MAAGSCELTGEIRYGGDLSFEEVGEVETELMSGLEALLSGFDPVYVDFRTSGDDFTFTCTLRAFEPEELRAMCWKLAAMVDAGAVGRLVAVEGGFGPVRVLNFSARGVDETCVG